MSVSREARDVMRKRWNEDWQNGSNDRATHKKLDDLECRFIDDVAAVKERAILGFGVGFRLENMRSEIDLVSRSRR